MHIQIDEALLVRYLANETTEIENQAIEQWRKDLPAHEKLLEEVDKLWHNASHLKTSLPTFDAEKAWSTFTENISETKVIPLATSTPKSYTWRVAASLLILVGIAWIWYSQIYSNTQNATIASLTKTKKETASIILEDKSKISLGHNAKITYPEKFTSKARNIILEGKAYFEISPDKTRPFTIKTSQDIYIKVLGTSFQVASYKEVGKVQVQVDEGSVEFGNPNEKITLKAGEIGIWEGKQNRLSKLNNTQYKKIQEQKLYTLNFQNTSLKAVADTLNMICDTHIEIDEALLQCPITVQFENQNINSILQIINETLELTELKKPYGVIFLTGKKCN